MGLDAQYYCVPLKPGQMSVDLKALKAKLDERFPDDIGRVEYEDEGEGEIRGTFRVGTHRRWYYKTFYIRSSRQFCIDVGQFLTAACPDHMILYGNDSGYVEQATPFTFALSNHLSE